MHDGRPHGSTRASSGIRRERDQSARSDLALADPHHDVGAARDEARFGIRGRELPGFFEGRGPVIRERHGGTHITSLGSGSGFRISRDHSSLAQATETSADEYRLRPARRRCARRTRVRRQARRRCASRKSVRHRRRRQADAATVGGRGREQAALHERRRSITPSMGVMGAWGICAARERARRPRSAGCFAVSGADGGVQRGLVRGAGPRWWRASGRSSAANSGSSATSRCHCTSLPTAM